MRKVNCPWRLPHGPHEWAEVDLEGGLGIGETRWCQGVPSGGTVDTHKEEDRL